MKRTYQILLISVALVGLFLLLHRLMSGNRTLLIPLANRIQLGATEVMVSEIISDSGKVSHRKSQEWSLLTTGLLSEWVLYVHYTNGVVDFVGIADSDRRRRPTEVPPWKTSERFQFEEAIRKGIS